MHLRLRLATILFALAQALPAGSAAAQPPGEARDVPPVKASTARTLVLPVLREFIDSLPV